jgi:hypothetical protein
VPTLHLNGEHDPLTVGVPNRFGAAVGPALEKIPSGMTLHSKFPSEDGVQAVCVWEAGSVEDVQSFVESATTGRSWTRTGDWPAADQYGIAAFGLDEGESLGALLEQGPPTPATANMIIDPEGFAWLPEDDFVSHFAVDVAPAKAKVMYAVQQPLLAAAFGEPMGAPA